MQGLSVGHIIETSFLQSQALPANCVHGYLATATFCFVWHYGQFGTDFSKKEAERKLIEITLGYFDLFGSPGPPGCPRLPGSPRTPYR